MPSHPARPRLPRSVSAPLSGPFLWMKGRNSFEAPHPLQGPVVNM